MAFQSPEGIVITWEPNIDSDLEGYYVYRRGENEAHPTRVSPLIKQETMYLDKTFASGLTYYYSVTAIDQSPRHNESDFSQELKVATRKP
jgi:fibronectin type 3 domain-containing protein